MPSTAGPSTANSRPNDSSNAVSYAAGTTTEDRFRLSMERYTAFDSNISALRDGTGTGAALDSSSRSQLPGPSQIVTTQEMDVGELSRYLSYWVKLC